MSKSMIDQDSKVALTPDALEALGVELDSEVSVDIVGRALVIRSKEEAERSNNFMSAFESLLTKRRSAYIELGKGPDQ